MDIYYKFWPKTQPLHPDALGHSCVLLQYDQKQQKQDVSLSDWL